MKETKSIIKASPNMVLIKLEVGDKEPTFVKPETIKINNISLENILGRLVKLENEYQEFVKKYAEENANIKAQINTIKDKTHENEFAIKDALRGLISR